MTTKLGKHKSAIIILTAILLYFSLLTYISYQRAPAQYRIDENTPSLAEYQDFIVMAGEEGAYVGQDSLMFDSADSSAEVFAARLSLTDLQKISVQFSVDCPEEYAGTTLHVDLYDGEAYDAPEQEFFVVLAPGVNQINEVLDKGENAPEEAWLRIFTLEPAKYAVDNLHIYAVTEKTNGSKEAAFALFLVAFCGAMAAFAYNRRKKPQKQRYGSELRLPAVPGIAPTQTESASKCENKIIAAFMTMPEKTELLTIIALFLISVVIRFAIGNFPKLLETYQDEFFYYSYARGILQGISFLTRNIPRTFQKIGYPLLLAPFFGIENGKSRISAIILLNCTLISASVFPFWLICKELRLKRTLRIPLCVLLLLLPEFCISAMFMSENAAYPWTFLLLWLAVWNDRKQSPVVSLLEGMLAYYGYLIKDTDLFFFAAIILVELLFPLFQYLQFHSQPKKLWTVYGRRLLNLFLCCGSFLICYRFLHPFLLDKFRYSGASGTSVGGIVDSLLSRSPYELYYIAYSVCCYLAASLIAVLVLPAIFPAVHWKKISAVNQKMYIFTMIYLFIAFLGISVLINVNENLGYAIPRIHFRYYAPAFALILLAFFLAVQTAIESRCILARRTLAVSIIVTVLACLVFKGHVVMSSMDQASISWIEVVRRFINPIEAPNGERFVAYPHMIIVGAVLMFFASAICVLFAYEKPKAAFLASFVVLSMLAVANSYYAYFVRIYPPYRAQSIDVAEVQTINDYFANDTKDENILFVYSDQAGWLGYKTKLMDTYMEQTEHLYYTSEAALFCDDRQEFDFTTEPVRDPIPGESYGMIGKANYVIVDNGIKNVGERFLEIEEISELKGSNFTVYRNLTPQILHFAPPIGLFEDALTIYLADTDQYNADRFELTGVYGKEMDFSWTEGEKLSLRLPVSEDITAVDVVIDVATTFNGAQSYHIVSQSLDIKRGTITGSGKICFTLPVRDGFLTFDMELPDAKVISQVIDSVDSRMVALALREIQFTQSKNALDDLILIPDELAANDCVRTDDTGNYVLQPGAVVFGPCEMIDEGFYTVTIEGENLDVLTPDVYSGTKNTLYQLYFWERTDESISYLVSIPEWVSDIEFRLWNYSEEDAAFSKMTITPNESG